jgi:poly(3-hydroxyalkanoate) synthetase
MFFRNLFSENYFTALIFRVYIKEEAVDFSKISAPVYQNIQYHIKEHCKLKSVYEADSTDRT